jgi:hypothetical protein
VRPSRVFVQSAGLWFLLCGLAAPSASCSGAKRADLGSRPDFVGWVTGIEPRNREGIGRLVVESQADKIVRRLVVTVTRDSRIYRREAGATRQVDFSDVAVQDQARLWLNAPVPRSFPAQATARQILIERVY